MTRRVVHHLFKQRKHRLTAAINKTLAADLDHIRLGQNLHRFGFGRLRHQGFVGQAACDQTLAKFRAPLKFENKLHFYPHDFGIFQSTSSDDYFMPDFAFLSFDKPTFPVQKGSFSLFLKLQIDLSCTKSRSVLCYTPCSSCQPSLQYAQALSLVSKVRLAHGSMTQKHARL